MDSIRIIKKYPNRRLYDTFLSRYITLEEIKGLVLSHIPFKILDDQSNDVTRAVLLNILTQAEDTANPLFTAPILQNMLRVYGHPVQQAMSKFLETHLTQFMQQLKSEE
jgi:polyhydroxyalkanoate synthesis repressor PhaR